MVVAEVVCTVYLDEVFFFNAAMDYIILSLTDRVCLGRAVKWRLAVSAVIGGIFSCMGIVFRLSFVSGLLFALISAAICFGVKPKCMLMTLVISACYGGMLELLSNIIGIYSVNGFGYIDIPLLLLLILSAAIYIPIKICFFIYNKKNSKRLCCGVILTEKGCVKAQLLIDSGCMLSCESNPVLLISNKVFVSNGRIPVKYSSVGGDGTIMCAYHEVFIEDKYFSKVAVGSVDLGNCDYQGIFPMYAYNI